MAEMQELRQQMEQQRQQIEEERQQMEERRQQMEERMEERRQQMEERRQQMEERMEERLRQMENGMRRDRQQNDMGELIDVMRRQGGRTRVKPPTFDGKQDVRKFLDMFDEVSELNDWDNHTAAIQLKLALRDRAAETIQGTTYRELRNYLLTRYEVTEDEARRQVRTARIRRGENIYDFGDYLLRMMTIAHPDLQQQQVENLTTKQILI